MRELDELYPYKSYEDWYDNGPGGERSLSRCRKMMQQPCENLFDQARQPKWISCDNEIPETGVQVLVTDGIKVTLGVKHSVSKSIWVWFITDEKSDIGAITHWMKLPELPK